MLAVYCCLLILPIIIVVNNNTMVCDHGELYILKNSTFSFQLDADKRFTLKEEENLNTSGVIKFKRWFTLSEPLYPSWVQLKGETEGTQKIEWTYAYESFGKDLHQLTVIVLESVDDKIVDVTGYGSHRPLPELSAAGEEYEFFKTAMHHLNGYGTRVKEVKFVHLCYNSQNGTIDWGKIPKLFPLPESDLTHDYVNAINIIVQEIVKKYRRLRKTDIQELVDLCDKVIKHRESMLKRLEPQASNAKRKAYTNTYNLWNTVKFRLAGVLKTEDWVWVWESRCDPGRGFIGAVWR